LERVEDAPDILLHLTELFSSCTPVDRMSLKVRVAIFHEMDLLFKRE
jgi:hypothetical protein